MANLSHAMSMTKSLYLKAPIEHIWTFLTESDRLALWFYAAAKPFEEGGAYTLLTNSHGKEGDRICWGNVLQLEPPKRLVHTFTHDHLRGVETVCTWQLEAFDADCSTPVTILTLHHTGFEKVGEGAFDIAADHDKGWDEHFIRLRRVTL